MSDNSWTAHSVSISDNNLNDAHTQQTTTTQQQQQRVVRTAQQHTSYSSTARTLSEEETEQSFNERGQIMNRHRRRITLSPSPDGETQEFGWGTTLVSTLHHGDTDQQGQVEELGNDYDDNNVQWHAIRRPSNNAGNSYVNEITTLRYNIDNTSRDGSLELTPPARSPHRSMSVDQQLQSTWQALGNMSNNTFVTTTTTGDDTGNSTGTRTIRYDPDVLRWHETESPVSTSNYSRFQQTSQTPHGGGQSSSSHLTGSRGGGQRRTTLEQKRSSDDLIEEVVRTIHASRTQPLPGLSHRAGSDDNGPGSSYDEELLLSGDGLARSSRIPRLNVMNNNETVSSSSNNSNSGGGGYNSMSEVERQTNINNNRQSQETNRGTFGSRKMSSGQLSTSEAGLEKLQAATDNQQYHQYQQQQQDRSVSHIPRPIASTGGNGNNNTNTNMVSSTSVIDGPGGSPKGGSPKQAGNTNRRDNNGQQQHSERHVRRTSITRIPGANLVDVQRRGSEGGNRRWSMSSRPNDSSLQSSQGSGRSTEWGGVGGGVAGVGGSGVSVTHREDRGQDQSNHGNSVQQQQQNTISNTTVPAVDNSGIRDPRKTNVSGGSRYAGLSTSKPATHNGNNVHGNDSNTAGNTAVSNTTGGMRQQGSGGMTTQTTAADNTNNQKTAPHGGYGLGAATGILAAAAAQHNNASAREKTITNNSGMLLANNTNNNRSAIGEAERPPMQQHPALANNNATTTTTGSGNDRVNKNETVHDPHNHPLTGSNTSSSSPTASNNDEKIAAAGAAGGGQQQQQQHQKVPPTAQHATFKNLPEPEKAQHHHHNANNNNQSPNHPQTPTHKGFGYRFREASLSTVGSIFKPGDHNHRRQSSVTVVTSDDDNNNHHRNGGRGAAEGDRYRDEAWDFLLRYRTERIIVVSRQHKYLRRLRLRIDLHLMIWLFLAYLMTFTDKILFNYARVMGILNELSFTTNDFANASSAFYIASLAFSLPNVWLLTKVPLGKLLAVDLIGWGICTALHAALRNYGGLVTLRVLSGVFEAGILPCLILLTGQYYTWREQPIRFAIWGSGIAFGQMLSGLLSWAFQHMSPRDHLSSWKTMYLVLGLLTVILGILIFFLIPDNPIKAHFLNNEEKVALLEHVKVNQTGIVNRRFHPKQVGEGLLDVGCWLLYLIVILQLISAGLTMFYSVTMLNGFGYSAERSALLNMPMGAINLVCLFLYAIFVRYVGMRWVVVSFAGIISTVGAALLFGLTAFGDNRRALLAGIYLINFMPGATIIVTYWLSCNVAGHTKRAYATAAMNAAYALGASIGPQTWRHQAVPGYRSAKLTLIITMAVTIVLPALAAGYFWYMNRSRDRKHEGSRVHEDDLDDATAYAGLTDKQNKAFRYRL